MKIKQNIVEALVEREYKFYCQFGDNMLDNFSKHQIEMYYNFISKKDAKKAMRKHFNSLTYKALLERQQVLKDMDKKDKKEKTFE